MDYIERSLERKIKDLLGKFPVVVLLGARQVGKSVLLKRILPRAKFFDLEDEQDFHLAENDPLIIFQDYPKPIVFDEAQLSIKLFKALRVEVDKTNHNGQFLLSGSSSPELLDNISETLAGRVAIVEVPCFDLSESHGVSKSLFLANISSLNDLKKLKPVNKIKDVFDSCLFGGYPQPFLLHQDLDYFDAWMSNYFKTYIDRDVRALFPTLKLDSFKKFIRMMARSSGEIINYSNFAKSLDVSQPTIKKYFEIADGTFIWRMQPPYTKNTKKTVIKMPKGHLRDSGLLCYLLNINTQDELKNHPQFGHIWESFIIEQIIKMTNLSYSKYEFYFYRTKAKSEIDLILNGRFGLVPIEIKSGISTTLKQITALKNFIAENDCPLAIVINRGNEIKMLADKIIQVPVMYI